MSSDGGRHEIEAAKQRLAAAKKLSSLTKAAYDAAEKEVKEYTQASKAEDKKKEASDFSVVAAVLVVVVVVVLSFSVS